MKTKVLIFLAMLLSTCQVCAVNVTLTMDADYGNPAMVQRLQNNLAALLNEINAAYDEKRNLNLRALPFRVPANINEASPVDELATLWDMAHFYCDDEVVVKRCWNMGDGSFFVRQIPLILDPDGEVVKSSKFQEASVSFDAEGNISEFRFALDAQLSESMEEAGNGVVSAERKNVILQFVERFRTAYCRKDIDFLNRIFSDDALIITGRVVQAKPNDMGRSNAKVEYNRQTKEQYIRNLRRAFMRNRYIDVKFDVVGDGSKTVTQSNNNPNFYGVRLRQEWRSSSYSDEGYVFLLWDFRDEDNPVIQVRTWQPVYTDTQTKTRLPDAAIFDISNVEDMIQ